MKEASAITSVSERNENKGKDILASLFVAVVVIIGALPHHYYVWFSDHLKTYPGDIWYVFDHYVRQGYPFPVEYPSLMRTFVQVVNTVTTKNYESYLWVTIYFFMPFAIGVTILLSRLLDRMRMPHARLYQFFILAPTFIICSTINYDLIAIFTIVLALSLAQSGKRLQGAICLGVGAAFKVFPCYFLPLILLLSRDWKEIIRTVAGFLGIWLAINLPYMIFDPNGLSGWLEPYRWQAMNNFAKGPGDGSLWWPLYRLLGNGFISLPLMALGLIFIIYKALSAKNFEENIFEWGRGIALLFLLTDRVYSPQYHLYLLPFLALSRQRISNLAFYALEIPNVCVIISLYYLRTHPVIMTPLMIIKYIALLALMIHFYTQEHNQGIVKV